jgi:hypothetical protein
MTPKNPAAVALGRRGGKARVQNQTAEQRSDSARRAAEARWAKTEKLVAEITSGSKELLKKTQAAARRKRGKKKKEKAE